MEPVKETRAGVIATTEFEPCEIHIESFVPAPESRIDVSVPSITGAQTVDLSTASMRGLGGVELKFDSAGRVVKRQATASSASS